MKMRNKYWGNKVLAPLTRITYVIRMGQHRVGREAKRKWLRELRQACNETLEIVDHELEMMEREDNAPF